MGIGLVLNCWIKSGGISTEARADSLRIGNNDANGPRADKVSGWSPVGEVGVKARDF